MTDKTWFLITTADERSWISNGPILFLGEWCRSYDRKKQWSKLNGEVVPPYGWLDGQREADYKYVQNIGEILLQELTDTLNHYHGTAHSLRYWRIILGSWLHRFISVVYNRWATVQLAIEQYPVSSTAILNITNMQMLPSDYLDFARLYRTDEWNHVIYGLILQECTNIPCVKIDINTKATFRAKQLNRMPLNKFKYRFRGLFLKGMRLYENLFGRSTDALLISTYLPFIEECKLHLSLGQIPIRRRSLPTPLTPSNDNARKQFRLNDNSFTGFEQFIRKLIPRQIPICYLEGYASLLEKVDKLFWPKMPKLIFTSNNFDGDEIFKAWTAAKVEQHVPYIVGQHGANYGASKFAPSERHEVATADRYLTWGWTDGCSKHYPVIAFPLVRRRSLRRDVKGGLLLVERSGGHREEPWDEMGVLDAYREDQFTFVDLLVESVRSVVTVRLFSANLAKNWFDHLRWKDRCPGIKIDFCVKPIESLIKKNRLTVFSYNSTGILELLALNVPIIIFFNDEHFPIRGSAEKYLQKLKDVGIFHSTPESASKKINEIWNDVEGWWECDEMQEARLMFCNRFAHASIKPIQVIRDALLTTSPEH